MQWKTEKPGTTSYRVTNEQSYTQGQLKNNTLCSEKTPTFVNDTFTGVWFTLLLAKTI